MLRDCFVETNESRKADIELEKIIQRVLNNIAPISTGGGGALQAELEQTIASKRSETVLLIGNKGAGKSTFIDRFFEQVLQRATREKCVVARVDLQDYHGEMRKQMQEHHMREVRETFIRYLLKIDAGRMNIPGNPAYSQIGKARVQIEGLLPRGPRIASKPPSKKPQFKRGARRAS
jgi:hypothetical protein